ncbi:glycine cleavage system protein H [bacterium J17]|nr:glycine cleavage system protein H [bacterium J17]
METKVGIKYTEEHEWAEQDGNKYKVGISDYAQTELGDIVYVEIPEVGRKVDKGEAFMVVESVKAVSDIYAPIQGTIVEVNQSLEDAPEEINSSPFDAGWLVVIESENAEQYQAMMDAEKYQAFVAEISK